MSRARSIDKIRQKREQQLNKSVIVSSVDSSLLLIIIFLTVFGVMSVFSAGVPEGIRVFDNASYFALRHIVFVVIGIILLFSTSKIDYKIWKKHTTAIGIGIAVLIMATLIPGLGRTSYGSSRWLAFFPLQPSELANLGCVLLAAKGLHRTKDIFTKKFWKCFGLVGAMVVLILLQPNLSIALLLSFTCIAMMAYSGVSLRLLGSMFLFVIPFLYYKIKNTPYQLNRITGWLNPWSDQQGTGYNLIQSWYAISSGGLLGTGYGNSKQKLFWLPFGHTDFIFSVISEEFGFIGSLMLLGLFVAFVLKGFAIAKRTPDSYGRLLAFGITFIVGLQALINIGVAVGVLPVTGVTLPLISYGGSSLIVTMIMLGILLNISRQRIQQIHE